MTVKNLLIVNTVYVLLIAVLSVVFSSTILEANGLDATDATINLQRVVGAVIVGYAVSGWLMRNAGPSEARRAFLIGGGVGYLFVALIFLVNFFTSDLGSAMTWVYIIISIVLGLAFLYFPFMQSEAE